MTSWKNSVHTNPSGSASMQRQLQPCFLPSLPLAILRKRPLQRTLDVKAIATNHEAANSTSTDAPSIMSYQQSSPQAPPATLEPLDDAAAQLHNNRSQLAPANIQMCATYLPAAVHYRRVEVQHALSTCQWQPAPHHLAKAALWASIKEDAMQQAAAEPMLASYLHMTVITHSTMEKGLAFLLANKLASGTLLSTQLTSLISQAYKEDPSLLEDCIADIQAVKDRDPACFNHLQCLLFFKGFQALQAHRVAHWMFNKGRRSLALALQSRMSEVFQVDIHPGAVVGRGIMIDHATGVVIGETATVGDNVVMLHHVTLGGSGTGQGVRHPTIGNGALLGAGVNVLGPVVVGHCTKVGAGSVVVTDLPAHCVAVGVPAQVVKRLDETVEPVKEMDMTTDFILDYII